MSDTFEQTAAEILERGTALIEEIKQQIDKAMEDLKIANKELEECPKEDARENAQLQTAREKQARANHVLFMLQKRLNAFEQSLMNYTPIGVVTLGTTVKLILETIDGKPPVGVESVFVLRLVHHDASDVAKGFMSIESRVGHEIKGHIEGDSVVVTPPRGTLRYKIERIY